MRGGWNQQIKGVTAERVVQTQIQIVDGNVVTDTDRAARELATAVRARLGDEIARLRLEHPGRIPVRWSPTGRPVRSPADALGVQGAALTGDANQVPEFLRSLPRRQLVVLGRPGAGKSVLALLLAWDLLKAWQPEEPVPVVLSLSSWRPSVGLREWMAQRIRELGPGHRTGRRRRADGARALLDDNRVMPVLDGLDELPPALHARAVEAIDAAVAEGLPLLVTCRGDEYEQTVRESGHYLTRAAVVELADVEPQDAVTYLQQSTVAGDRRWDGVFDALRGRPDSALAAALSSPLMLYLARTAYQAGSTDPAELLSQERFATREEIEAHLLERYLPAAYTESTGRRFGTDRARRYLTTIAHQMQRDGTYDFAWWQVHSVVTGVVVGAAFGLSYGWFFHMLFGTRLAVLSGVMTGAVGGGVHIMVRRGLTQVYVTEDVLRGPRGVLRQYAVIGCVSGLGVALLLATAMGGWLTRVLGAEPEAVYGFSALVGGAAGLATLLGSAWGSYQVSRTWFWLTRQLPWRFWTFLDDAHERGVLRQTGAVHQFRHLRVQEQLSGAGTSSRSAVRPRWAGRHWKFVLPVLPSALQALLAAAWLFATGSSYSLNGSEEELIPGAGHRPVPVESTVCLADPLSCTTTIDAWTWKLPQGAALRTEFTVPEPDGAAFTRWNGTAEVAGCAGAAVEVALRMGDRPAAVFVVTAGAPGPVTVAQQASMPEPVRLDGDPVSAGLRRVDTQACDAVLTWESAGLHRDGLDLARRRLGLDQPVKP
ncbi:NACHT domain-containing protein [Streptomyces bambusae]|uniref:NACHT domain-containing protein n=1 Tax=Streptomyces bambusae TaxID=1550616 RepID=A0ABS6Z3W8_9ACTN|nr:NACHT domain-containing protein [Streptomyces bambusae]MBW5482445.1 NACHT domain-containing protein [Streptomyces bambusae]